MADGGWRMAEGVELKRSRRYYFRRVASAFDVNNVAVEASGKHWDADLRILQAMAGGEGEMLLVHWRSDNDFALDIADDAAREHVRAGERIVIVDRVEPVVVEAEHRDLATVRQCAYAGVGNDVVEPADRNPVAVCRRWLVAGG